MGDATEDQGGSGAPVAPTRSSVLNSLIQEVFLDPQQPDRALSEILDASHVRIGAALDRVRTGVHAGALVNAKREFEEANRLFPLVFARAFQELKASRPLVPTEAAAASASHLAADAAAAATAPEGEDVVYPLDETQRDLVLEIERVSAELSRDLQALKARGAADDILQATCAKLLARAKDSLTRRDSSADFAARYLDMTKNSLVTAYRQVRARLSRVGG